MAQTVEPEHKLVVSTISAAPAIVADSFTVPLPAARPLIKHEPDDSLFNRFAWLYVFFRERLFRDDTERIVRALWPDAAPTENTRLIELGCGPGYYSCNLAARFPGLTVLGVDRAARQLDWARRKARQHGLLNCRFETDNVLELSHPNQNFDAVIAARLFTILPDQKRALAEMFRILRPGGRCLVAEPRFAFWASLPLLAMWLLARLTGMNNGFCEPRKAIVFSRTAFDALFATQLWRNVSTWQDGRYQYALCEKA